MTAGLEYAVNEYCFLGRKQQPSSFNPHISFSLLGGANYLFRTQGQDGWGYAAGLAGEMQITPYSGVRVMFDRSSLYGTDINMANISADYVFDLGTMLQGYDVNNRFDIALAAGPVFSRQGQNKKNALGVQAGIPVSYRLTPRLALLFEPRARFFDMFDNDGNAANNYLPNAYAGFASNVLSTQVGLRYSLNDHFYVAKDSLHERFEAEPGRLFAHMAAGVQPLSSIYDMGPRIEAGLGYWFNPGVAARGSVILGSHDLNRETPINRQMSLSGRLDVMLDPFGYLANRYDRLFGFNFIGGVEFGKMSRGYSLGQYGNLYSAFSAGVQLRYNYDGYRALYLEPRYTSYRVLGDVPYDEKGKPLLSKNGGYLSLVAGMELGATDYAFRSGKSQPGEFKPSYSFALLGGAGYVYGAYSNTSVKDITGGLAAEYKYSPYSGVRLTANYSNYRGISDGARDYINLGVDYMFDITTLLQGYTYDRKWNAALAVGPTVGYRVNADDDFKFGVGPQVGIPVSYNFNDSWAIMLEPRGKVYLNQHLFNSGYSHQLLRFMQVDALLGMKYTPTDQLYDHLDELNQEYDVRREFINYSMGLQYAAGTEVPFGSTSGVQFGFGYGRWMNSLLGVRFGAEMAASHLTESAGLLNKTARLGARADMLLNPLALSSGYTPSRWGTALLLGWELGVRGAGKYPLNQLSFTDNVYNSFGLGAQLRYHTNDEHALYIEPRYMVTDKLVSLTAGMEYAMSEHRFLKSKNQPSEFEPYYNVGLAGGLSHLLLMDQNKDPKYLGYNVGLSGEYHFTPYSGFRFTLGYAGVNNESGNKYVGHLNTGFDYMFDLSTLFAGYTPDRRWDVALAAGPVFSSAGSDQFLGVQAGVPVQYHINSNLGVSLEPRARVYPPVGNRNQNPITDGTSEVVDLLVGVKYTPGENFNNRMEAINASHDSRHDFVNYAIGLQYATGNEKFFPTGGLQLGLGAGRWINSLLGVRLGAEMAAIRTDDVFKSTRIGGRADVLINPLALSYNYTPSRLGAALILGWELGHKFGDTDYRGFYQSLGLGAQLRYHTDENHALYLEPRYMLNDGLVQLTAGMEYAMSEYRFRSSKNQPGAFRPYYSVGLAGGVSQPSPFRATSSDMPLVGARLGATGEYHFTPYSGARLTASFGWIGNKNDANVGLDYMFDLSTLVAGYTLDRRWDVMLAAGPLFELKGHHTGLKSYFGAQVGIPVQYRLNKNWGISLEPRARMIANVETKNISELADVLLGMKYTIEKERFEDFVRDTKDDFVEYVRENQKPEGSRFFTDFGLGMQKVMGSDLSAGPRATASLGYWLNSDFALRGSLLFSSYNWQSGQYSNTDYEQNTAAGAGRLDLVVNPLNFFMGRSYRKFDVNVLAGWEVGGDFRNRPVAGLMEKLKMSHGPTVGMQLLYNQSSSHALYLEPRYIRSMSVDNKENLWALTGGLYFTSSDYALRSKKRQPERFVSELSIALSGGVDMPIRPTVYDGTSVAGFTPGLTGEYRFSPYSGLRMSLNHTTIRNCYPSVSNGSITNNRIQYLTLSGDYVFDFTTLLRGYTSDRKWDVGIAMGLVLGHELTTGMDNFGAQLSVPVTYNVNDRLGILFEPRGRAFLGDYLLHRTIDWNGNISPLHMTAQLGLKYTIDETRFAEYKSEAKKVNGNRLFTDFGLGMQTGLDNDAIGPRAAASLGYWLNSDFALRGSLLLSANSYDEGDNFGVAGAARADVLVNPLNFFMGRTFRTFDLNALVGFESGLDLRQRVGGYKEWYNGVSAGLQLLYNQSASQSWYLEPRYVYSMSDVNESLFALTAGMYFTSSDKASRSKVRQNAQFMPSFSLAFSGGADMPLRLDGAPLVADLSTGVTGEFRFGPYSGLRLGINHTTKDNVEDRPFGNMSISAGYLFDFTTLLNGYTFDRKWNVSVALGPVYTFNMRNRREINDWGAQLSLPIAYNVSERFGILFEPVGRVYPGDYIKYKQLEWNRSIPYLQLNSQLGLKYTFGNSMRTKTKDENSASRDFVNLAMGVQAKGVDFGGTGDFQVGAGLGRWFNPAWGVRFSGEFASSCYDNDNKLKAARLGARMDVLFNPFALKHGYEPTRWEVALLAGSESGIGLHRCCAGSGYYYFDKSTYNSLSAGFQIRRNTNENHVLYVEPRYSFHSTLENLVSVTAGLEFSMTENRFRSSKNQKGEFKPYCAVGLAYDFSHPFSFVVSNSQASHGVGLSGEYHFTPYSGARLSFDTSRLALGADYMFDLSTLFAGYTADRRLEVAVAAGPVFGNINKGLKKSAMGGQFGIPVQFRINDNWGISFEPRARMFVKNSSSKSINLQLGAKYTF